MTEGKYDAIRPVLIEELHKFHFFCKGLLFFELLSKGVFHFVRLILRIDFRILTN